MRQRCKRDVTVHIQLFNSSDLNFHYKMFIFSKNFKFKIYKNITFILYKVNDKWNSLDNIYLKKLSSILKEIKKKKKHYQME